jgi:hypothetical protein
MVWLRMVKASQPPGGPDRSALVSAVEGSLAATG